MFAMKRAQILPISGRLLSATAISRPQLPLPHRTSPPPRCNISPQFTSAGDDKISFFGTATNSPNLFLSMKSSGASNEEKIDCYFKTSALMNAWKFVEVEKLGIMLYMCKTIKQLKQVHVRMLVNCLRDDDNCNYLADKVMLLSSDLIYFDYAYKVLMYLSSNRNLSSYNTLIKCSIGKSDYLAVSAYNRMRYQDNISPDRFTLGFLFKSFASSDRLKSGKTMHGHVIKLGFVSDTFVMNSLLEFYFNFVKGRHQLRAVRKVFGEMPYRDIVSWNAMIAGLLNKDLFSEALSVFDDMLLLADHRCKPDETTLINIISNKGIFLSPELGKWLDAYIKEKKLVLSLPLGNALMHMFVYYYDLGNAKVVFKSMSKKSTYTWKLMIDLLVSHKFFKEALLLFDIMCCCSEEEGGPKPDVFIFYSILSAFNNDLSLVGDGKRLFRAIHKMMYVFGVQPNFDVYYILSTILVQVGWLEAAMIVREISPFGTVFVSYFSSGDEVKREAPSEVSDYLLDEVKREASSEVSDYLQDELKGISVTEAQHAQETHPLLEDDDDVYKVAESLLRQLLDLHDQMMNITDDPCQLAI